MIANCNHQPAGFIPFCSTKRLLLMVNFGQVMVALLAVKDAEESPPYSKEEDDST
jgi:hypothetical protein